MKVILYDLDRAYDAVIASKCDHAIAADGKYAPCQGCFGCWTKHPAECFMKDQLQQVCRVIGQADELVIITKNLYGEYSAAVKNILDRSIGTSTPFSTYRGRQMHHTLRYGKHDLWKVIVYGDITEAEKETFRYRARKKWRDCCENCLYQLQPEKAVLRLRLFPLPAAAVRRRQKGYGKAADPGGSCPYPVSAS